MKKYELTINMFLAHYLNVNLNSYSNKKWTHVKIHEIIRNRRLQNIIISDNYARHKALRDNDSIYKGDILLVRDQKGKLEPYYNPYHLENISECYMGLNDKETLLIKIKLLKKQIENTYLQTKFTLENLSEEFKEYDIIIKKLEDQKQELKELCDLYELYSLEKNQIKENKTKIKTKKRRENYDKYKRK